MDGWSAAASQSANAASASAGGMTIGVCGKRISTSHRQGIQTNVAERERSGSEEKQSHVALNQRQLQRSLWTGYESTPSGLAYILSVEPRTNNKLLYRGRIWVDAEDFAVVRIEAVPAKNPSFWTKETKIEQVYTKVGDFWLPLSNRSTSAIRLGGQCNFTIDYQDYQITSATAVGTPRKVAGYR